jgi:hypothetical protein
MSSWPSLLVQQLAWCVLSYTKQLVVESGDFALYPSAFSHMFSINYIFELLCYQPPSRDAVNALFEASDADNSGGIDREEFNVILNVSCTQIMGRILVNYATMIFFIPFLAKKIVDRSGIGEGSYMETVCEQLTGLVLFLLIVPLLWTRIDNEASQSAGRQAKKQWTVRKEKESSGKEDESLDKKKDE